MNSNGYNYKTVMLMEIAAPQHKSSDPCSFIGKFTKKSCEFGKYCLRPAVAIRVFGRFFWQAFLIAAAVVTAGLPPAAALGLAETVEQSVLAPVLLVYPVDITAFGARGDDVDLNTWASIIAHTEGLLLDNVQVNGRKVAIL